MADTTSTKSIMSLIATTSSRIRDLIIKDGQLIFIQDLGRIAFDFKGKRVFYNQIVELNTEAERLALESPLDGYYFVIDSACLWFYQSGWIQITENSSQRISPNPAESKRILQYDYPQRNTWEGLDCTCNQRYQL